MNSLSTNDKQALLASLQAQRTEILAKMQQQLHASGDPAQRALAERIGPGDDRGLADADTEAMLSLVQHEGRELREILAAIARAEEGSYGQCVDCSATIPVARLKAYPAATHCIACQEALEKRAAR